MKGIGSRNQQKRTLGRFIDFLVPFWCFLVATRHRTVQDGYIETRRDDEPNERTTEMIITAKFASTCPSCSRYISPGDKVEWTKGAKATHVNCSAAPRSVGAKAARKSLYGRRTGCSCGSRENSAGELIPSKNNCWNCTFDGFDC